MGKIQTTVTLPKRILLEGWANSYQNTNINGEFIFIGDYNFYKNAYINPSVIVTDGVPVDQDEFAIDYNPVIFFNDTDAVQVSRRNKWVLFANDVSWINDSTDRNRIPLTNWRIDGALGSAGTITILENISGKNNKISIKKQNLTKLKPYSIDGGVTTYDDTAVYIFKGGSINTVSTVFNYLELQGGSSIGNSDGIFLSVSNTYVFYKSSGFGGTGWRRSDTNTDATNLVINENELIYFIPRSLKEISVGSGAIIQKNNNGEMILNNYSANDADARNYILAVEAVEGPLEVGVKKAINDFVVGCKNDGIWTAIKASCLLAGPKTLNGTLIPLAGTAPTNINFTSSDYNRKTGLKGDGSTKYLNSNRANNADPQDSKHVAAYLTESMTRSGIKVTMGIDTLTLYLATTASSLSYRINILNTTNTSITNSDPTILGLFGGSRSSSSNVNARYNQNNATLANTSTTPSSDNIYIFTRLSLTQYSDARMAFYSIGENIDLEKLENRVKTYVNALSNLPI